jgi:hypothetical protein
LLAGLGAIIEDGKIEAHEVQETLQVLGEEHSDGFVAEIVNILQMETVATKCVCNVVA